MHHVVKINKVNTSGPPQFDVHEINRCSLKIFFTQPCFRLRNSPKRYASSFNCRTEKKWIIKTKRQISLCTLLVESNTLCLYQAYMCHFVGSRNKSYFFIHVLKWPNLIVYMDNSKDNCCVIHHSISDIDLAQLNDW